MRNGLLRDAETVAHSFFSLPASGAAFMLGNLMVRAAKPTGELGLMTVTYVLTTIFTEGRKEGHMLRGDR